MHESNDMLAALVETTSAYKTLLFLLERSSGAPITEGLLIWYAAASPIDEIKPHRTQLMHWSSGDTLWILTGRQSGTDL
jgi:hypothetical protein